MIWGIFMVNPSTAKGVQVGPYRYRLERDLSEYNAADNDHTIAKLFGFGRRHNATRLIVGNKFAYQATDVNELATVEDPVGPENDDHIEQIMRDAQFHIVAWGRLSKLPVRLRSRWLRILTIADRVGVKLHCFGVGADGHPKHPLTLGYDTPIIEWKRP